MKCEIPSNVSLVVILDISGLYAQIYDQGYCTSEDIEKFKSTYSDDTKWRIVIV